MIEDSNNPYPRLCDKRRIEIQYAFANHFEEAVVKAINETGSLSLSNVKEARRDKEEHKIGIHNPDIILIMNNNEEKRLEVKQDGRGLDTQNLFIEEKTLLECSFDFILFTPSYWWWEGRQERNFAYLFTKEQVRDLALSVGKRINHAGDNWKDKEGNIINNAGWIVKQEQIAKQYQDNTFLLLSQQYHNAYASLQRQVLEKWDWCSRDRKQKVINRAKNRLDKINLNH